MGRFLPPEFFGVPPYNQQTWFPSALQGSYTQPDFGYGVRYDGMPKGLGYFGRLQRPNGQISTELTSTFGMGGKTVGAPLLVPTLTDQEIQHLLSGNRPTPEIFQKAAEHMKYRTQQQKSPYAQVGEQTERFK